MPLNFKFVSNGQAVVDAATFTQVLRGNSLKPLAPVNLRGMRNAAGDLYIAWDRRARLGPGLRPGTGGPLAEEIEIYQVEIYDGSTLLRTWRSEPHIAQAAILTGFFFDGAGIQGPSAIDGNNVLQPPTDGSSSSRAFSNQIIDRLAFVDAKLVTTGGGASGHNAILGTLPPDEAQVLTTTGTGWYSFEFFQNASAQTFLVVRDNTTTIYSSGALSGSPTSVQIRMAFSDSDVAFYRDYGGVGSVPLVVATTPPHFPYAVTFVANQTARIDNIFIANSQTPGAVYSAAQQSTDFGSPQSTIKVRVYQLSAIVGAGPYIEALL